MDTHEIEIRVRYNETDSMGFLHHAQYFVYFELGRTELLRARGGNYRDVEAAGLFLVVVQLECRFRKSARYDELLTLQTTLEKITPAKMHHKYRLYRAGELLAEAQSGLACVDRQGSIQRLPEDGDLPAWLARRAAAPPA